MSRPAVDIVVPFAGPVAALAELTARLAGLNLRPGDSVLVVDNTPAADSGQRTLANGIPLLQAAELSTPAYARNRGAAQGSAPWILFFDADTEPSADLLDRYFDPPPAPATALLAGGVRDELVPPDGLPAMRYAYIRGSMNQQNTFDFGDWSYPMTANAAFRRTAFESVGGFRENIRAAEDADITWRLKQAGWGVERRENATVTHLSRRTLSSFIAQKALHGAGGAWLDRQYPGSFPARRRPGIVWWAVRTTARELAAAVRSRDRDAALWAVFGPVEALAWEFGRSLPNERPLTAAVWRLALRHLIPPQGTPRI